MMPFAKDMATFNRSDDSVGSAKKGHKMAQRILGALLALACMTEAAANVAPTVSLGALPASVAAPAAISLSATAADSDGSVAKVEFYNGAALLATVTQAPYSFNWTGVAAGTYVITARATDNTGAQTTTVASSVTVTGGAAQVYYIYSDQIDTAKEIVNAAGVKVWQADTEPFGANPPNENPAGQGAFTYNQRFPGQYFDRETGLHYNYHRDYDPQTGRYIQSDPIGLEGGINTYGYVAGNPVTFVDPDGLQLKGAVGGLIVPPGQPSIPLVDPNEQPLPATPSMSLPSTESAYQAWCKASPLACSLNFAVDYAASSIIAACKSDESEKDRCAKVWKSCSDSCTDQYVNGTLPGSGPDMASRMRLCIRNCMRANGCNKY